MQIEDQTGVVLARMALYGEARGERDANRDLDALGMYLVYCVIYTRTRLRKQTLAQVILSKWQFSFLNDGDPNRSKLLTAWHDDPVSWERADAVADIFESGCTWDPTDGATHYCTASLWNIDDAGRDHPRWHSKQEIDAGRTVLKFQRGHHIFAVAP